MKTASARAVLFMSTLACATTFVACGTSFAQTAPTSRRAIDAPRPTTQPFYGRTELGAHDPSTIVRAGDTYYVFLTGPGIGIATSPDLKDWRFQRHVFDKPLPWFTEVAPGNRGHLWAPDIIRLDDEKGERWLLYYSVSMMGKRTSAIALATNRTLDPTSPNYKWEDTGLIIQTHETDEFNAIDPAMFRDDDGRLWMVFGSYWMGIHLIELDPATGLRKKDDPEPRRLAWNPQIEAGFVTKHAGKYVLFVNYGSCCDGLKSTYNIRVGKSDKIEGPYLDREGKPMIEQGGTLILDRQGDNYGPGHAGIVTDPAGTQWLSHHIYDATRNGHPMLAIRRLTWDAEGWPVVEGWTPSK